MHSESSRQAAPMGLRETPLQNGVILRSLIFEALSSGTGEPLTCKAKAFTLRHGTAGTLLCTLKEYCPLECYCLRQSKRVILLVWVWFVNPPHSMPMCQCTSALTWSRSNRQSMSTAKSLRNHILTEEMLEPESQGAVPIAFYRQKSTSFMVARWDGGKVYICNQGRFNKLMSTGGLCSGPAIQAYCIYWSLTWTLSGYVVGLDPNPFYQVSTAPPTPPTPATWSSWGKSGTWHSLILKYLSEIILELK